MSETIGQKIKQLRKERGFTQMDLAERVNVSYQQVQKYEKGETNISIQRLAEIARALEVPITLFLGEPRYGFIGTGEEPETYRHKKTVPMQVTQEEATCLKLLRKVENKKVKDGFIKMLKGTVELEAKGKEDSAE